ncbi:hypothetical protein [Nannocystis punicea]|uniref:Uncharacterized protein n=1 Tax=Nannocystis punicea TaxID=2995304 RepID=A0ABY7H725_9BACT|nr:hypothetical protein [Nannocystis poenicansa]WAS94968.1 hypothetical protein O0S08_02300 [Nannocystis poenicansa]
MVAITALAGVLRQLFDDDALLLVTLVAVMIGLLVIGGWIERRRSPSVGLLLPSCRSCHELQAQQERQDRGMGISFVLSISVLLLGMVLDVDSFTLAGGILLAGAVVWLIVRVRRPAAAILAAWAKEQEVALLVDAKIARAVIRHGEGLGAESGEPSPSPG